jgi:hypothetical protein
MRIAIAEACPELFRRCNCSHECSLLVFRGSGTKVDPLTDLNAMAAAEHTIKGHHSWGEYKRQLSIICQTGYEFPVDATALQRAEAFLRTKTKTPAPALKESLTPAPNEKE